MNRALPFLAFAMFATCSNQSPESADETAKTTEDYRFGRAWSSNADGYVYSTSFFTPDQVAAKDWEDARLLKSKTAQFCDNPKMVRRDVRWFDPIADDQPRCAQVMYSFQCPSRKPEWGGSLESTRENLMQQEPASRITLGCKTISPTNLTGSRDGFASPRGVMLHESANCKARPDIATGQFRLRDVNRVHAQSYVSPDYVRHANPPYPHDPALFLVNLGRGSSPRFVEAPADAPYDSDNIFINMTFAASGPGYCVIFEARQGESEWRRTIYRGPSPQDGPRVKLIDQHSPDPDRYWDQYSDSHLLEHEFAEHIGLRIPEGHGKPG